LLFCTVKLAPPAAFGGPRLDNLASGTGLRPLADRMAGAMSKPLRLRSLGQKRPRLSLAGYQRPVRAGRHRLATRIEAVPEEPPLEYPPPVERLRNAALRLTAELDEARLYQAAAYVAMAVDAMSQRPEDAVNDNRPGSDMECEFELDEHGRVWMIRDGDCHIIGRREDIRKEMWRFLRVLLPTLG
jgi:hypothetical protein